MFFKIGVLENSSVFTGKHLSWCLFSSASVFLGILPNFQEEIFLWNSVTLSELKKCKIPERTTSYGVSMSSDMDWNREKQLNLKKTLDKNSSRIQTTQENKLATDTICKSGLFWD